MLLPDNVVHVLGESLHSIRLYRHIEVPQRMQLITVFLLLATYIPCLFLSACFIYLALSHLRLDPVLEHCVPSLMTPIDVRYLICSPVSYFVAFFRADILLVLACSSISNIYFLGIIVRFQQPVSKSR